MDFRTPAVDTLQVSYDVALTDEERILAALVAGGIAVPGRPAPGKAAKPADR